MEACYGVGPGECRAAPGPCSRFLLPQPCEPCNQAGSCPVPATCRRCRPVTSRRCILLEEGVRELLEMEHYTVRIIRSGIRSVPRRHLVASRGKGETRYIRIKKVIHRSRIAQNIETRCRAEIRQYRRIISGQEAPPCTARSGSIPRMTAFIVTRCSPSLCGKFPNWHPMLVNYCRTRRHQNDLTGFFSCGEELVGKITGVTGKPVLPVTDRLAFALHPASPYRPEG